MSEQRVERRLAAILAADVVGYSRLIGDDEEGTLAALRALRRDVIEPTSAAARPAPSGGRPAALYRYAARTLVVTNPFAAFRPPRAHTG